MSEFKPKVVLALIEKDGKFLLIRRLVPQRKLAWAFPGGVTEQGETDEEAVVREAKEEVCLNVSVVEKLLERKHPDTFVQIVYFHCQPKSKEEKAAIGEDYEIAEIEWVAADKVMEKFTSDVHPVIQEFLDKFS